MGSTNRPRTSPIQGRTPSYTTMHGQPPPRENLEAGIEINDPYILGTKYPEMAQCERCGIVYHAGRWYLEKDLPRKLADQVGQGAAVNCPACRKIDDMYALGVIEVRGEFALKHREEIEGMARGVEKRNRQRNPLERIMKVSSRDDGYDILCTDEGLAQHIGRMLQQSYDGEIRYDFDGSNQKFLRVMWHREQ